MRKYIDFIINLSNRNKNWKVIKILIWEKKYNLMRRNKKDSKIDELLITFKYFYTWYFTPFNLIIDIQPKHERIAMNDQTTREKKLNASSHKTLLYLLTFHKTRSNSSQSKKKHY